MKLVDIANNLAVIYILLTIIDDLSPDKFKNRIEEYVRRVFRESSEGILSFLKKETKSLGDWSIKNRVFFLRLLCASLALGVFSVYGHNGFSLFIFFFFLGLFGLFLCTADDFFLARKILSVSLGAIFLTFSWVIGNANKGQIAVFKLLCSVIIFVIARLTGAVVGL